MKNKGTIIWLVLSYIALVTIITLALVFFRSREQFFFDMATAIILSWIIVLIVYYIWAIYFYNVNMGWDDDDWEKLADRKNNGDGSGILDDEPTSNPHAGETLGLPPGTVRGTVAVSLLVAGLAMVIASFQLNQTYDANVLFVDNFEFFKTAFLMMIAFYFGNKSLEAIGNRNQGVYKPNQASGQSQTGGGTENSSGLSGTATSNPIPAPNLATGQASTLKNTLQTEAALETTDTDDSSDFEDKDSVG